MKISNILRKSEVAIADVLVIKSEIYNLFSFLNSCSIKFTPYEIKELTVLQLTLVLKKLFVLSFSNSNLT